MTGASATGQPAQRELRRNAERLMSTKTMCAKSPVLETHREALSLINAWVMIHGSEWVAEISDVLIKSESSSSKKYSFLDSTSKHSISVTIPFKSLTERQFS